MVVGLLFAWFGCSSCVGWFYFDCLYVTVVGIVVIGSFVCGFALWLVCCGGCCFTG